jgi:flagellar biosynthesis/type III secretory pathway M-ring protein FliF/YscJ
VTSELRTSIVSAGEIALAITAILALFMMVLRYFVKQIDKRIAEHVKTIDDRLDKVETRTEQLLPNGGSSLADSIHRLEARQLGEIAEQKAIRRALEEHLSEHRAIGGDSHR